MGSGEDGLMAITNKELIEMKRAALVSDEQIALEKLITEIEALKTALGGVIRINHNQRAGLSRGCRGNDLTLDMMDAAAIARAALGLNSSKTFGEPDTQVT